MKYQNASAEGISTLGVVASACSAHASDGLLRHNVVVVVSAAVFLSLVDLVVWTSGAFKILSSGLPAQLLTIVHTLRGVWKGHSPPAVVKLTTLLWGDSPVVTSVCADFSANFYFGAREFLLNNGVNASVFY